jgi:hypothetical protein
LRYRDRVDDAVIVTRDADFDVPADDLWELLADGTSWGEWLGERADIDVAPGATGTVRDDDGVERQVRVERVDRAEGIRFTWWPSSDPGQASRVELAVVERPGGGTTLRITEVLGPTISARASAAATARAWDVRLLVLWMRAGWVAAV